jgi:hypothetical protein
MAYYPMNSSIRVTWDTPLDASVNKISQGVTLNSYDIIAKSATATYVAPYATIDKLQPSYVTKINDPITPLEENIVMNKYADPSNVLQNIVNGSRYTAGVRATGFIGGYTMNGETLPLTQINGVVAQYLVDASTAPVQVQPGTPPLSVSNLTSAAKAGTVTISWNKVASASHYHIYQDDELVDILVVTGDTSTPLKFSQPLPLSPVNDASASLYRNPTVPNTYLTNIKYTNNSTLSVDINGLTNGKSYTFGVVTVQGGIQSQASTITGTPYTQPDPVQNLKFAVSDSQIALNWDAPISGGGAGVAGNGSLFYKVVLYTDVSGAQTEANATNTASTWNTPVQTSINISATNFTISSLTNGKYYKAEVQSYYLVENNVEKGSFSTLETKYGIVPNAAPQDVSGVTITTSDRNVVLKWENPTDQGIYPRDYIILSRTVRNSDDVELTDMSFNIELNANIVTYVDTSINLLTSINASGTRSANGLTSYIYNGNTYSYKVISHHTKLVQAQQPSGITVSGVPSGKPIFWTQVFPSGDKKQFHVVVNKNGTNLLNYVVLGTPDASSGLQVPIITGNFDGAVYSNAPNNSKALALNQNTQWTFTMQTTVNALFIVVTNSQGIVTGTYPIGTTLFNAIQDA